MPFFCIWRKYISASDFCLFLRSASVWKPQWLDGVSFYPVTAAFRISEYGHPLCCWLGISFDGIASRWWGLGQLCSFLLRSAGPVLYCTPRKWLRQSPAWFFIYLKGKHDWYFSAVYKVNIVVVYYAKSEGHIPVMRESFLGWVLVATSPYLKESWNAFAFKWLQLRGN